MYEVVQIEPTYGCNMSCIMCSPVPTTTFMSLNTLKNIFSKMGYVTYVNMVGHGEPFLNPNISELAQYTQEYSKVSTVVTNGSIYSDAIWDFDIVTISLHDTDPIRYNTITGYQLEPLLENISRILQNKRDYGYHTVINVVNIVSTINENFIEEIRTAEIELGLEDIWFAPCMNDFLPGVIVSIDDILPASSSLPSIMEKPSCSNGYKPFFISAEGYVIPKCCTTDISIFNCGNINSDSLESIEQCVMNCCNIHPPCYVV